ncbi:hypothetical protein AMELA_G00104500 [Ameiurus melas]|uniref:Uncharacterized protein n=1 Tax=Ameiurus melas TaxID=219545 RepID=A0A7J6ATQ8_AMEME|nr:hypothetical protein AMELA_G00104500 [Ameiurus melas]
MTSAIQVVRGGVQSGPRRAHTHRALGGDCSKRTCKVTCSPKLYAYFMKPAFTNRTGFKASFGRWDRTDLATQGRRVRLHSVNSRFVWTEWESCHLH